MRPLKRLLELLSAGEQAVLVTLLESRVSRAGSGAGVMAVWESGVCGSVGEGAFVAEVLRAAAQTLKDGRPRLLDITLSDLERSAASMACGGEARILCERYGPEELEFLCEVLSASIAGDSVWLTKVHDDGGELRISRRVMPRAGLRVVEGCHVMPLAPQFGLLLVGAGYVGVEIAHMASRVGFPVLVLDDRPELADPGRFPDGVDVRVVASLGSCLRGIPVDDRTFVCIVERGRRRDGTLLKEVLKTSAAWIGMIGSLKEREALYASLRVEGVPAEELARVSCPAGLPILAETPEEISVSIVAEIVRERARLRGFLASSHAGRSS